MKKVLAVFLLFVSSCASFPASIGRVQDTAMAARMAFQPVVDGICRDFAEKCRDEKLAMFTQEIPGRQTACDNFETCDRSRLLMIKVFEHINMLIADANMSYQIGDQESADSAIKKALELLEMLRDQLRHLGYLK